MKFWLALLLCAWTFAAGAQGNPLYAQIASVNFGRQVGPESAEAKLAEQLITGVAKAYNVKVDDVLQTSGAALKVLRQKEKDAQLFDLFEAAQMIAPSEPKKDRSGLVHALTTYIGTYEAKSGPQAHEKAINEVIAQNKAGIALPK